MQVAGCAADGGVVRTDHLLDRADDLLHGGRAGQAASLLAPVVGEEPGNAGAWLLLARARLALGQPEQALSAARAALRLEPGGVEPLFWVSAAYSVLGRHDLAIAAATTACHEEPGHPRLAERLGRALLAAGRPADAEHTLRIAAEFAHYDADLQVAYGVALLATGRPLSAREAHGRALRIEPDHQPAQAELSRLAAAERRVVDAASLVRVTDEYAESLRVPPGGRPRTAPGRDVLAHVTAVVFGVCLAAVLALAVLGGATTAGVPLPLMTALLGAAGSAGCATLLARRTGG